MAVYVFNPLEDVTLLFEGRPHVFPKDKVTEVEDQTFSAPDLYKRHHPSDADANAMLHSTVDAESFARHLLNRQYLNLLDAGFYLGAERPTEIQKTACRQRAVVYKRKCIDEALQERRERMAGGKGRLAFDEKLIGWMQELGINDDLYNPNAKDERLAMAIAGALSTALNGPAKEEPVLSKK